MNEGRNTDEVLGDVPAIPEGFTSSQELVSVFDRLGEKDSMQLASKYGEPSLEVLRAAGLL